MRIRRPTCIQIPHTQHGHYASGWQLMSISIHFYLWLTIPTRFYLESLPGYTDACTACHLLDWITSYSCCLTPCPWFFFCSVLRREIFFSRLESLEDKYSSACECSHDGALRPKASIAYSAHDIDTWCTHYYFKAFTQHSAVFVIISLTECLINLDNMHFSALQQCFPLECTTIYFLFNWVSSQIWIICLFVHYTSLLSLNVVQY